MRGTFDLPWRLKMHAWASECTKTIVDIKMPSTNRTWKVDEVPVEAVESTRSAVLISFPLSFYAFPGRTTYNWRLWQSKAIH